MKPKILLIDDTRDEASRGLSMKVDLIARTYWAGLLALKAQSWDLILLDHDLQSYDSEGKERTGYDLICAIERMIASGEMEKPKKIVCVSSNPPGRDRIEMVIASLYRGD
jgi:hypothetical protein